MATIMQEEPEMGWDIAVRGPEGMMLSHILYQVEKSNIHPVLKEPATYESV